MTTPFPANAGPARPVLASPTRIGIGAIPVVGFLATPLLPFVNGPYLWFGVPSVLVWTAICVVATVVALRIVEASYLRDGGAALDALDQNDDQNDDQTGAVR